MHDRYYEEYERHNWDKRKAVVAAFAELFVPTTSAIVTDAFGVLVIVLVPVVVLQKLAIVSSFWILAITVAELLLNPIVYYYLRAPDPDVVQARDKGWYKHIVEVTRTGSCPRGRADLVRVLACRWCSASSSRAASRSATRPSPRRSSGATRRTTSRTPHPGQVRRRRAADRRRRGHDRDAMKDPQVLRTMEKFQRYLERDRDVGYSVSLADILRAVSAVFHELEPKWGVIPNNSRDVAQTFFIFFSGSPPTETAKWVDPSYTTAHVTFFARNHKGDNVARIIERCKEFIAANPMEKADFKLAGGLIGVLAGRRTTSS
jgi:predicted RND superfamily exporter protein